MLRAIEIVSGCWLAQKTRYTARREPRCAQSLTKIAYFPTISVWNRTTGLPNQSILRYVLGGWPAPASKTPVHCFKLRGRRSPRDGNSTATHANKTLVASALLLQLGGSSAPYRAGESHEPGGIPRRPAHLFRSLHLSAYVPHAPGTPFHPGRFLQ